MIRAEKPNNSKTNVTQAPRRNRLTRDRSIDVLLQTCSPVAPCSAPPSALSSLPAAAKPPRARAARRHADDARRLAVRVADALRHRILRRCTPTRSASSRC